MLNLSNSSIEKAFNYPSDKVSFQVYNLPDGKFAVKIFSNISFKAAFLSLNSISFSNKNHSAYTFVYLNRVDVLWKRLLMFIMEYTPLEDRQVVNVFFINETNKRKDDIDAIYEKTDLFELSNYLNS